MQEQALFEKRVSIPLTPENARFSLCAGGLLSLSLSSPDGTVEEGVKERVRSELHKYFRPEFINRVDDIVVFSPLTESQIASIISIAMGGLVKRLAERDIAITLTDAAVAFIARAAYDPAFGARPVKRYLQKHVETELAAMLIRGAVSDGQSVTVDADGEKLNFSVA